ncbi:MAG: hypothetical protein ACFCU4_08895 [Puniceicoccaceae bacterium]
MSKDSKQNLVKKLATFSADELAILLADLALEDEATAKAVDYSCRETIRKDSLNRFGARSPG